jgi:hypothetical protein
MLPEEIRAQISVERVRADVEHITTQIPSRLAGSENGRRMAEYSLQTLSAVGVTAHLHAMPGLVSFPERGELHVHGDNEVVIEANTLGHSTPTPAEGLSGELMDVRSGSFEDYDGRDATGKITMSELSYHPARHEKQRIAAIKGAAGCVMMNWGSPDNAVVPFGSVKPAWGNPTLETFSTEMPTLPCVGIARNAGLQLREMLATAPVKVRLRANVENIWRPVQITTGEIKAPVSDDFVVVGGHQDSWPGPQATDNAAGSACIYELARLFNRNRQKLRRGLVMGLWSGHETGTMIGSSWFVDKEWDRLRRHAVAYLQIDQPACAGTTCWGTASNMEMRNFHRSIERQELGGRMTTWSRAAKNGDSSFFGLGIPMLQGQGTFTKAELEATALANFGWWHHSTENTVDKLDWDYMSEHLKVYAGYIWELCTAVILPYEFAPVGEQFVERLHALTISGQSIGIAAACEAAMEFHQTARRLDQVAHSWRVKYAAGEPNEAPAAMLNGCFRQLSRTLIPLASTSKGTYGHDPYGFTPQGTMIPSLFQVPDLDGLPEDAQRWMLQTHLIRERNRVTDGLGDATALVVQTLAVLAS